MSTGTAQGYCLDCGKFFNMDCGHVCQYPGQGRALAFRPVEFVTIQESELDQLRETNRAMKEQLDIATDLGQERFEENVRLRAEVTRLEGINETALHLLTQYGDKADEYEAAHRAQAAKIAELAAYVGAGKAVEGDSEIPY
jgi:predicted FMN-binding regulatory protein PaiB